jgi:hypothetical protein
MGLVFRVITADCWLDGYWWWVCPQGQSTGKQTFALWVPYPPLAANNGALVRAATITSGPLMPGQWNFVPLPEAVPLAIGTWYVATTGITGSYPVTGNMFGTGDHYANGVVNGPLLAPSDTASSLATDNGYGQCPVALNKGADPRRTCRSMRLPPMPNTGSTRRSPPSARRRLIPVVP